MNISDFTVRLIILLIPGLIAAIIVEKLTHHRPWSPFFFTLYSILLGSASYAFYQLALYMPTLKVLWSKDPYHPTAIKLWTSLFKKETSISLGEVALACVFAVIIGYLVSWFIEDKLLFKIARRLKVTNKFGDEDVWAYFLNSKSVEWVWVRDHSRGLVYQGLVQFFSVTSDVREILLLQVKVFSNDTSECIYEVPAMYLSRVSSDITIELPINGGEVCKHGEEALQATGGGGEEGCSEAKTNETRTENSSATTETAKQRKN